MPTSEPALCEHPYAEMMWRISCHTDLTAPECRGSDQRSALCCDRPACLQAVSHWVAGAGHGVHRVASRHARQTVGTAPQTDLVQARCGCWYTRHGAIQAVCPKHRRTIA